MRLLLLNHVSHEREVSSRLLVRTRKMAAPCWVRRSCCCCGEEEEDEEDRKETEEEEEAVQMEEVCLMKSSSSLSLPSAQVSEEEKMKTFLTGLSRSDDEQQ